MTYSCLVSLAELDAFALLFKECLKPNTVLLLQGNLGAGKTTFMQSLGKSLGVKETITSPTFTIIDEYFSGLIPLYHIDLYRLEPSAVQELHPELYWQGEFEPGIVAIEWSNRLITMPPEFIQINFIHYGNEDERQLNWEAQGENAGLILDQFWRALTQKRKSITPKDRQSED